MAAKKRESTDSARSGRAAKAQKTNDSSKEAKVEKQPMPPSRFKEHALPLHVNITHTPPVIPADDAVPSSSLDPGHIAATTLVPSVFSTGSYGWKGSRRVTIEFQDSEGGEKERVQVMITINATVLGSKQAKEKGGETVEKEDEDKVQEPTDGVDQA